MTSENNGYKKNVRPIYRKEYGRLIDCDHVVLLQWGQIYVALLGLKGLEEGLNKDG